MTQSEVTVQAKAGNPAAIAALLNRTLQPRGITSTTQLDGICLTIELTAAHPIPQASAIAFIQRGMNQLKPKGIESVLVSARHPDHSDLDWLESFLLDDVTTSPVAQRWQPAPQQTYLCPMQWDPQRTALSRRQSLHRRATGDRPDPQPRDRGVPSPQVPQHRQQTAT